MAKINLSDHYTYKKLLRLAIAPILVMIFVSLYSVVDGVCIANFAGHDAFAGANLIYPITMIVGGIGFMFGAGGSALVGKLLGEKNTVKANEVFTSVTIFTIILGALFSISAYFAIEPIANKLGEITNGTTQGMIDEAIKYGRIIIIGEVPFILQCYFQNMFIVDEKPHLGFAFCAIAGTINIILDIVLIKYCKMGVEGAAIGTVIGYVCGGIGPLIYFIFYKKGTIYFVKPKINIKDVIKVILNGLSEFLNNISMCIVNIVFNAELLRHYGQIGVEAYGIIMYVILIFIAIFIGYCQSVAPVISYHFGAKNKDELKNLLKKTFLIILITSIAMIALGEGLSYPLSLLFSNGSNELIELTTYAMRIWSISFIFCGFSMFASSLFTALNNGLISAIISISRTLIINISILYLFSYTIGGNGIWWSTNISEFLALVLSFAFIFSYRKKYEYL